MGHTKEMKIIIIEGPDNCGKNTIIHNIIDNNDSVKVIHCHKPDTAAVDPLAEMTKVFFHHADCVINDYMTQNTDVVVFNRYYFGEWVYGQLYRHENPVEIMNLIQSLEQYLLTYIDHEDIYYIQLLSSSAELLSMNDDGDSLSNAEVHNIEKEISLFKEVCTISNLKKKMFYINERNSYRTRQDIINEVNSFIQN